MRFDADTLMSMLPAIHRLRDEQRHELRALLGVISEQVGVVEDNLEQLYDDQFIETCADWVIPYIADLLGTSPLVAGSSAADDEPRELFPDLVGPHFVPGAALRGRADAGKTIYYRKRKLTLPVAEELAHDVTGWTARVVEFFERLRWTQCVRNHLRLFSTACPDIRRRELLDRLNGPFDTISHNVDVRPIAEDTGWYETRNLGVFLWRLGSYAIGGADPLATGADARGAGGYRFYANQLGLDVPLFTRSAQADGVGVSEEQVPGPIRQSFFRDDLRMLHALPTPLPALSKLYGAVTSGSSEQQRSLAIAADGHDIPAELICPADLSSWRRPQGNIVAVDVATSRIAFGADYVPDPSNVRVSYHYGFSADMGGGTYPRAGWMVRPGNAALLTVNKGTSLDTLAGALQAWRDGGRKNTIISITDDRTYDETAALRIDPPQGSLLVIQAADHCRPHIIATTPIVVACGSGATATLSGLLIEGALSLESVAGNLRLLHTTLVPVNAVNSIDIAPAAANDDLFQLDIAFSITGAMRIPRHARGIRIFDSIIDAGAVTAIDGTSGESGPSLRIERTTVFGAVRVHELPMATEVIFTGPLFVDRRQAGCLRFSFVPGGSNAPRRYRCQPDLEIATRVERQETVSKRRLTKDEIKAISDAVRAFLAPSFTSRHYGDPGYAQLHLTAPRQITRGAEDGSEMGAFCHLKQPQQEANLRMRFAEYVPFGLQPGIIYVT